MKELAQRAAKGGPLGKFLSPSFSASLTGKTRYFCVWSVMFLIFCYNINHF